MDGSFHRSDYAELCPITAHLQDRHRNTVGEIIDSPALLLSTSMTICSLLESASVHCSQDLTVPHNGNGVVGRPSPKLLAASCLSLHPR